MLLPRAGQVAVFRHCQAGEEAPLPFWELTWTFLYFLGKNNRSHSGIFVLQEGHGESNHFCVFLPLSSFGGGRCFGRVRSDDALGECKGTRGASAGAWERTVGFLPRSGGCM